MRLYNWKRQRYVERQVHFAIGQSVRMACGIILFSQTVMVQLGSDSDGRLATADMGKVTCKNCLRMRETKIRRLVAIESAVPGLFDRPALCGEEWLLTHALDVGIQAIEGQSLEVTVPGRKVVLSPAMKSKDRRTILAGMKERVNA